MRALRERHLARRGRRPPPAVPGHEGQPGSPEGSPGAKAAPAGRPRMTPRVGPFSLDEYRRLLERDKPLVSVECPFPSEPTLLDALQAARFRGGAIISSMTRNERRAPEALGPARRERIARGAGVSIEEVDGLLEGFFEVRAVMEALP